MTTYYVDSHGSNTAPYDTWAKAATTLAVIAAIDAAGDTIYVAHNHAETTGTSITYNWAGTGFNPTKIICADSTSGAPPTTLATGASVRVSGTNISLGLSTSGGVHWYGINFQGGVGDTGSSSINMNSGGYANTFTDCTFTIDSTGSAWMSVCGGVNYADTTFIRCGFKFGAAGQGLIQFRGLPLFRDCYLMAGGVSPTALIISPTPVGIGLFEGLDLTEANAAINLWGAAALYGNFRFRNTKLPSGWSGQPCVITGTSDGETRVELTAADTGATNYRLWIKCDWGDIKSETTLIRTDGANDGATGLSWQMVTTANAKWTNPLTSGEIVKWNAIVGSPITVEVEILHDSATDLKDYEVWLDVMYFGSSATPLGSFINDTKADILATAVDQDVSSATWTTTGMSNPNTQKLSVTFTPQMAGAIHAVVKVAKASYTVYVDPLLTVT